MTARAANRILGRLLQEEKVGTMQFDQGGNIRNARAGQPQQVPAYDFQVSNPRPAVVGSQVSFANRDLEMSNKPTQP